MGLVIFDFGYPYNKFYLSDLITGELIECSERDFDDIVVRFRNLYEMEYETVNRAVFKRNGRIEAACERYYPELERKRRGRKNDKN